MKWKIYPSGAHIDLLNEGFIIYISKVRNAWESFYFLQPGGSGKGIRIISRSKTKRSAMKFVETWLIEQAHKITEGAK
jgi:hypothetical protein